MDRKINSVYHWWLGLIPPLRVGLIVLPLLVVALVLILVLRPGPAPEETAPSSPTPFGKLYSFPTSTITGSPPTMLDDGRFLYEPGWGAAEVNRFLAGRSGVLGAWRSWVGDQEVPLGDVIAGYSLLYGINPKIVLALLEFQSGLVDGPSPSAETLDWAMGYHADDTRGLEAQVHWAVRELFRGTRDYPATALVLLGGETAPVPAGANMAGYALLRLVGQTGDQALLQRLQGNDERSFVQVYQRLFGEDPRRPLAELPLPAARPFLTQPYVGTYEVSSLFDHHGPFLKEDGSLVSHLGVESPGLSYDGHDGWDYALDAGVPVLAAADGLVTWAGNLDDGCATVSQGAILDHGNGYQTIYWHFSQVDVQIGQQVAQGQQIGLAGASGCANGPHLHFGVHFLGRETDPEGWCGQGDDPWATNPAGAASTWLWADRFSPCQLSAGAVLVDDSSAAFQHAGVNWSEDGGGVGGKAQWAASEPRSGVEQAGSAGQLDGVVEGATWRPTLAHEGRYHVYVFVPYWNNGTPDTQAAHYLVHHAEGETLVDVDQSLHVDRWVDLGVYTFAAGQQGFLYLDNLTDEAGFCVWFDAAVWVPEE